MKNKKNQQGQALFEVVMAVGVILILIIALISVATLSLFNAQFSRNQSLATKYAQEALEKIRAYRDNNSWEDFVANCETVELGIEEELSEKNFSLERDCYLNEENPDLDCMIDADECQVKIEVFWTDSKGMHKSELKTKLNNLKNET